MLNVTDMRNLQKNAPQSQRQDAGMLYEHRFGDGQKTTGDNVVNQGSPRVKLQ